MEGRKRRIFYPTHPHPSFASQMPPSPCEGEGLRTDEDIGPYAGVAAVLQGRQSAARRPGAVSHPCVMLSGSEASVLPAFFKIERLPQSPAATAPSKREITDSSASPQNDGRMPSPGGRWLAEGQTDEGTFRSWACPAVSRPPDAVPPPSPFRAKKKYLSYLI